MGRPISGRPSGDAPVSGRLEAIYSRSHAQRLLHALRQAGPLQGPKKNKGPSPVSLDLITHVRPLLFQKHAGSTARGCTNFKKN